MKWATVVLFIVESLLLQSIPPVQAREQAHSINQGIVRDLDRMSGMLTEINRLYGREGITTDQRQQLLKMMGELGSVMQQMGSAGEIEGWRLGKERNRLDGIRKRLDGMKREQGVK